MIELVEFGEYQDTGLVGQNLINFKHFLQETWANRKRYTEEELENSEQRFFIFDGSKIKARNYAGFINFEGTRIQIYPKICTNKESISQILYWLGYSKRIKFPFSEIHVNTESIEDWLEVFIYLFAYSTEETLRNQPFQAYQEVTEETSYLRGRLAMSEYIKYNLQNGRHQFIYSTHEPFVFDNTFNRIVKFVSRLLMSVSNNQTSIQKLQNVLFLLDEVSDVPCKAEDCDTVKLNPLFQELEQVLSQCRMFLEMTSPNAKNAENTNFSLLFPMEVIFEDFVFGFIERHLPNCNAHSQSGQYLAKNALGKDAFLLKNDILLTTPKLIIDTKYKIRKKEDKKQGVAESDIYQMLAYAIKRPCENVLLIYPQINDNDSIEPDAFTINSKFLTDEITIKAVDINVCINTACENRLVDEFSKIFAYISPVLRLE
jgi:5-methylcytosine-specific restriction enzyme subunit McrC